MAARNWTALKQEWLASGFSMRAFAKSKRIPIKTLEKQAAKYKWKESGRKLGAKTEIKTIERLADKLARMNDRHFKVGAAALAKLVERLKDGRFRTLDEAMRHLLAIVKVQREALGAAGHIVDVNLEDLDPTEYQIAKAIALARNVAEARKRKT